MIDRLTRRDFVLSGAAAVPLVRSAVTNAGGLGAPAVLLQPPSRPCLVGSANCLRGMPHAMDLVTQGTDTLDAAIEVVKVPELDPNDQSVGYGGLPNAEGVVQLDASCMHGPTRRAGAVGAIEGIKTPSEVARCVLKYTNHILLVGKGAQDFAVQFGFRIEDLLTDASRQAWLRWKAGQNRDDYREITEGEAFGVPPHGTCNCNAVNANGDISTVTTTAGLAFKLPGRVGDSPIIGDGDYVDNDVGAAGSTGRGESNMMICGAAHVVELMRRGMAPTDACLEALRRAVAMSEPGLLDERGRPKYGLTYYALNKRGEFGSANMTAGAQYAVHDGREARLADCAYLYEGAHH